MEVHVEYIDTCGVLTLRRRHGDENTYGIYLRCQNKAEATMELLEEMGEQGVPPEVLDHPDMFSAVQRAVDGLSFCPRGEDGELVEKGHASPEEWEEAVNQCGSRAWFRVGWTY